MISAGGVLGAGRFHHRAEEQEGRQELISLPPRSRTPWALLLTPFNLVSDFSACRVL
jgi:hypothetical protein